jgi:hypothetical protein
VQQTARSHKKQKFTTPLHDATVELLSDSFARHLKST